tara:strand:+ start:509 stop:637 length:129 start_codon:yes stop_codon:yes gene_type:complete
MPKNGMFDFIKKSQKKAKKKQKNCKKTTVFKSKRFGQILLLS